MKRFGLKKRKVNNQGMTLVEVIVAVAILSFAILPILYTFVYTTRFNMKSREQQRATSAAEAILEKYKAYPLSEIQDSFSNSSFSVGENTISGGSFHMDLASNPSKYVIQNVNFEKNSGDSKTSYDALVEVSTYQNNTDYNGIFYEFDNANIYNDAVYLGDESNDSSTYQKVLRKVQETWNGLSRHSSFSGAFPEEHLEFKRQLTFTITKESGDVYKIKQALIYTYRVPKFQYKDAYGNMVWFDQFDTMDYIGNGHDGITGSAFYFEAGSNDSERLLYDNSAIPSGRNSKLDRLFVYYFPMYTVSSTDSWVDGDTIEFYNATGDTIQVYLYKQRSLGLSPASLHSLEANSYNSQRTKVCVKQGRIEFYHNLDKNIGDVGSGITSNGIAMHTIISTESGCAFVDMNTAPTPTPIPKADILSDVTVKIYSKGSLNNDGSLQADSRLLAEISSTINGK